MKTYKTEKQIEEIMNKVKKGEYVIERNSLGNRIFVRYIPVEDSYSKLYSIVKALTEDGSNEISDLGLKFTSSSPKPEAIIKFLIESITKE